MPRPATLYLRYSDSQKFTLWYYFYRLTFRKSRTLVSSYFLIVTIVIMADKSGVPKDKLKKKKNLKKTCSARFKTINSVSQNIFCFWKGSIEKKTTITTGYHTPIHDNSTSEKHKNISGDLNQIQQSLTKIRGTMVKKLDVKVWETQKFC